MYLPKKSQDELILVKVSGNSQPGRRFLGLHHTSVAKIMSGDWVTAYHFYAEIDNFGQSGLGLSINHIRLQGEEGFDKKS